MFALHSGQSLDRRAGVGNRALAGCHMCFYFSLYINCKLSDESQVTNISGAAVNLDFFSVRVTILLSIIVIIAVIVDIRDVCSEFINQRE